MTMEDIHDATETFARYGVPADRISVKSCGHGTWIMSFFKSI